MGSAEFSVYIVRCHDDTYYTGIALDVERRLREHACGSRGAKYLRGRGPLQLVFSQCVGDRALASKIEHQIKRLAREQKEALIAGDSSIAGLILENSDRAAEFR